MNDENLHEVLKESESLSGSDEKLRLLLGNLKKIDAPQNFDFNLKRRIAEFQSSPAAQQKSWLFPILRYAAPFCLLILLAGFVIFNLAFSTGIDDVPQVADNFTQPQKNKISPENSSVGQNYSVLPNNPSSVKKEEISPVSIAQSGKSGLAKPNFINSLRSQKMKTNDDEFGGTRESTSSQSKIITRHDVFKANQNAQKPADFTQNNSISVREILSPLGIEANFTEPNWQVKSVKSNSLAERAGVKSGDLIEAIDDKKLSSETISTRIFSGKTIHLLRDGKKIVVELGKSQ